MPDHDLSISDHTLAYLDITWSYFDITSRKMAITRPILQKHAKTKSHPGINDHNLIIIAISLCITRQTWPDLGITRNNLAIFWHTYPYFGRILL